MWKIFLKKFHSRKLNRRINKIHEHELYIIITNVFLFFYDSRKKPTEISH